MSTVDITRAREQDMEFQVVVKQFIEYRFTGDTDDGDTPEGLIDKVASGDWPDKDNEVKWDQTQVFDAGTGQLLVTSEGGDDGVMHTLGLPRRVKRETPEGFGYFDHR